MKHEQHPGYGGLLVDNEQDLKEFLLEQRLFLPQSRNINQTFTSVFAYIDIDRELLLFSKADNKKYGPKIKNEVEEKNASVRRGSLFATGLNALGPLDEKENFLQLGGPFFVSIKTPGFPKPREYAKFLFVISDFSEVIHNPKNFIWVPFSLVPIVFHSTLFFTNEPFVLLEKYIDDIHKKNSHEQLVGKW